MARKENKSTPAVRSGVLYSEDQYTGARVGSPEWAAFLTTGASFYYEARSGATFTARCEKRRNGLFWYAFRKLGGKVMKRYLGLSSGLNQEWLDKIADDLAYQAGFDALNALPFDLGN